MVRKMLNEKGAFDYDFTNDILFFKVKNRAYARSIELDNIVIDIDKEDFIVGIQIFEASKFLTLPKKYLLSIPKWLFRADLHENRLEVRLVFQVKIRNKIIERSPIIVERIREKLPDMMVSVPAVRR